ncbi:N-acetyltransferase family protein [Colwellia sp. E150_009]|mgnify:CR=1 FL=1|jgi:L-amino acid N-acyltransferase YncA
MSNTIIREAQNSDSEQLYMLFKKHAEYESCILHVSNQKQALSNLDEYPMKIFVAEYENVIIGYLSVIKQFSTWDMDYYLYVDCLYLTPKARGKLLGKKLMYLAREYGNSISISKLQWQTPVENINASGFYSSIGAESKNKQRFYWS